MATKNIYDLPLGTRLWDVAKKMEGKITKVHPPKNYHYRWYTLTLENRTSRRVYTWNFPQYFQVITPSGQERYAISESQVRRGN